MSAPRIPPSSTSLTDTARPGLRAKTVATRLSPEELRRVSTTLRHMIMEFIEL
jgi:hypothetical protein